jgi:hypothetical protein
MNVVPHATPSIAVEYVLGAPADTVRARIQRKFREEVLPHFYAPASRQLALESVAPPPMIAEADAELDSPTFTPSELTSFASRGFVRTNRWVAKGRRGG